MLPNIGEWASQPAIVLTCLLSVRLSAVFLMTPALFAVQVPPSVRTLLIVTLSIAMALGQAGAAPRADLSALSHDPGALMLAVLTEAALGAVLAVSILLAFAAFSVAGALLDTQIGFGLAMVFDPVSRRQAPILSAAFNQVAVVVFFLVNGHHALLRGLAYSLERFPVGRPWNIEPVFSVLIKQVGSLFSLGFALAAPVACCMLFVDFTLAVISRNLPQMNMIVMGIPAKIVAGLVALTLWQAGIGNVMSQVYRSIYTGWDQVFGAVASEAGK